MDLKWLSAFESDSARLLAILIVALCVVIVRCIGPISRAWVEDREHQRKFTLENRRLQDKIAERRNQRRENQRRDTPRK
jgi:hypothetical protein